MVIFWLLLMGLFIAALAGPAARQFGWTYGRFGRFGDMAAVIVAAIVGGLALTVIAGLLGFELGGDTGALVGGFVGAMIAVLLLLVFGAVSAASEPNRAGEADPAGPTPPGNQPPTNDRGNVSARTRDSKSGIAP